MYLNIVQKILKNVKIGLMWLHRHITFKKTKSIALQINNKPLSEEDMRD